jgi:hypothetical protein
VYALEDCSSVVWRFEMLSVPSICATSSQMSAGTWILRTSSLIALVMWLKFVATYIATALLCRRSNRKSSPCCEATRVVLCPALIFNFYCGLRGW